MFVTLIIPCSLIIRSLRIFFKDSFSSILFTASATDVPETGGAVEGFAPTESLRGNLALLSSVTCPVYGLPDWEVEFSTTVKVVFLAFSNCLMNSD
jgi:hypothetical protein